MPVPRQELEEVGRRAHEIYERDLRHLVEPDHIGKFLLLDVETGEYEIDTSELAAGHRAEAKRPGGARSRFLFRIGYPAAHKIGGSSLRWAR
jgi:hypothetical protein